MGAVFLPLYIRLMGAEAYGLVGIATTLQGLFAVLDLGVSQTIRRELARLTKQGSEGPEAGRMAATLETITWLMALVVAAVAISLAPFIARYWVNPEHLSTSVVEKALMLIGVWVALRWPASLYSFGLMGLQRQAILNILNSTAATARGLGSLLVLWLISPTILSFMIFQLVTLGCEVTVQRYFMWRELPRGGKGVWLDRESLKSVYRFSLGVTGIDVTNMLLHAMDRVVLSKMLGLADFGYYSLARTVAEMLGRVALPVQQAVYPQLTALVEVGASLRVKELYHKACQTTSVLLVPPALALMLFSDTILRLWTRDAILAQKTALVLSALSVGSYLWCLRLLPFSLQLAAGWTSLTLVQNLAGLLILTPLLWIVTRSYGMMGGAAFWILLNLSFTIVGTAIMHTRLVQGEYRNWLLLDVLLPLCAGLCAMEGLKLWISPGLSVPQDFLLLFGVCITGLGAALLAATWPREIIVGYCRLLLAQLGVVKQH